METAMKRLKFRQATPYRTHAIHGAIAPAPAIEKIMGIVSANVFF